MLLMYQSAPVMVHNIFDTALFGIMLMLLLLAYHHTLYIYAYQPNSFNTLFERISN